VFALACGASFLLYLHRYTWNLVGPEIQRDFRLSNTRSGFLFSLFYYTYAAGQVPSGVVIDRFGPHRFLATILVAWSAAIALIGRAATSWVLGLLRLVFGAAQAGGYPALTNITRNWFPVSGRTVVQGWIATTAGRAGGAMSPIILGVVLMGWFGLSWQDSLAVLGLVGVAFGLLFAILFRDTPADHPGVNEAERTLIAAGTEPSPSTAEPLPAGRAWRSRSLRYFVLQQFLDAGSDVAFVYLIGKYFLQARGLDIAGSGWLSSLPLWGGALGGIAGGWLNDRLLAGTGSRRWARVSVGAAGKLVGCVLIAIVVRQTGATAAGLCLMGAKFFSDWSQPTSWGACTDLGGRYTATVFSIVNTSGTVGGIVMPIVFGAVLDRFTTVSATHVSTTDWGPLFLLLASMYLASGLCWLLVDCSRTLDEAPAA
jgi:sugar phosphate permease